ncbi:MAG: orotidine-5'-phosphate decarboxylase [Candidatus Latescibacterota bacterium]|nr:orotidine-5'-phosphate decarboxylase [Candidatus Latescibacterota bacterium]
MSFQSKLLQATQQNNSLLCVGLDSELSKLPDCTRSKDNPVLYFNKQVIDATADLVCCYKPNYAFYGALGAAGWETLRATIEHIPSHIPVLVDAKVGDIGNTAQQYAQMFFDGLRADGLTVTPYMGRDCVAPFLSYRDKATFIVCLTSNKGADDFEKRTLEIRPLYEEVIARVQQWTEHDNCGLVIGATQPNYFARVRALAPNMPLLIPGVGAQGGSAEEAVSNGQDKEGTGILINSSRGIIFASSGDDFAAAAGTAARNLRDELNQHRSST